ncbi:MAG: hypothetical protein JXR66_10215, partial [Bacteroidales bacterium]|nr:hypothetical protein [Bacteroidales bacterium]
QGKTGIRLHEDTAISPEPFYASLADSILLDDKFSALASPRLYSRLEKMAVLSINDVLEKTGFEIHNERTLFILSTTKGNIDLLRSDHGGTPQLKDVYLWHTARKIQRYFGFANEPLVVSDACISGIQAIITGSRLIRGGFFDHVIINGTDIITEFVYSGFNSFKSLSTGPCRPFDKSRDGLSLGEGSGTLILSARPFSTEKKPVKAGHGFSSNDANHISGPSRTGEGLYLAISKLLEKEPEDIAFISAHGTATPYNDEMESIAITRAGLQEIPVNSLKGYWGHTLGAAGILESVMSIWSLINGVVPSTMGFTEMGVSHPLNITRSAIKVNTGKCLKIASGFGGCNAVISFSIQ